MKCKCIDALKAGLMGLACLGMILPASVLYAGNGNTTGNLDSMSVDVRLHSDGLLQGQVVDGHGLPLVGIPVSLRYQDREIAVIATDRSGGFRFSGVRSGGHQLVAGNMRQICRTWSQHNAPPSAQSGVRIVMPDGPVRGQSGPIGYWLGNPWVIAGLVAVAVAIPVAIHNHRARRPSS